MSRVFRGALALGALLVTSVSSLPACSQTANVSDVYMALDAEGLRKRNVFFTDSKEIHCVAELGIGRDGVTIEGLIRQQQRYDFDQRKFLDGDRVFASAENSPGRAESVQKFDIKLEKTDKDGTTGDDIPYPPGRYQCEVYLDGELKGTALFNVQFPECPLSQIRSKTICIGFYEQGKVCPAYGSSSTDPATCTCDPVSGWSCP